VISNRTEESSKRKTKTMEEDMKIQIFDGKSYNIWKKRILMYLKWKKCDEAVIRVKLPTDSETT